MTRRTVTMMQELPHFLRGCSVEELYQLARALRHDLARRGLLSTIEADALIDALLGEARTEHRAIFSADCTPEPGVLTSAVEAYYSRLHPLDRAPAES